MKARADGLCERCGQERARETQHRRARLKGGGARDDPIAIAVICVVRLCRACHHRVEVAARKAAEAEGWWVRRPVDPATVPILHWMYGAVFLTPEGTYQRGDAA